MHNLTLIDILKTFSQQEMKEFSIFIQSPYFNTNQSVIKLFEQIRKYHPKFDEKQLQKKMLFEKAFGKIKCGESFMGMTISRLLELAKEFMIQKNLQRNDLNKDTVLLDELNFRELHDLMLKSIKSLEKKFVKKKAKEADSYLAKYRLEYFKNEVKANDTKLITYKDTLDEKLMLEQKSLNIFFFINSLKFCQYFLNQRTFVVNAKGYPDFMNSIFDYLKQDSEYLKIPVLKVYYNICLMLITNEEKYFFELKKMLFESKDSISYNEKFNMTVLLRNYAQKKFNDGREEFINYIIDFIKFSIKNDLLSVSQHGRYISEMRFMTIVWAGIRSNEIEWVENFIKKFKDRIEPDKKQYVLAYFLACIEFDRKNFSGALEKLVKSGPIKNVFYKSAIKQMTIMIYYELGWLVQAAELLDSYVHFVKTNKLLPDMYIDKCNSFIGYFSRLLKLKNKAGNNAYEVSKLISELEPTPEKWLLKKAKELNNK